MLRNQTVLITGCLGFVGCWLAEQLCARDCRVLGLDRGAPVSGSLFERLGLVARVAAHQADVADPSLLHELLREHRPAALFHLAGQAQVGLAMQQPQATFDANIRGTWSVLESVRTNAPHCAVLLASTDTVYAPADNAPWTEHSPTLPAQPYTASKLCAETLFHCYRHAYALNGCIVRFSNLYGPGDSNEQRLIPGTIRSVLAGRAPEIRGHPHAQRDYVYILDAVDAMIRLAEAAGRPQVGGETFNVSSGTSTSVADIVRLVTELAGRTDLRPIISGPSAAPPPAQQTAPEKLQAVLDWRCRYDLRHGLQQTLAWHQNHPAPSIPRSN